ncbi:glycogen debranching protein GlgX [Photobacterium aphoticum]|uniref:Glycogen debranching protein n=1 Tax=Photobacterium aphoticum TaxID=754436 RepID=A0A0J1GQ43_9GAMM|nr:glycogen debranching protein GlgX [Photobacterium aphoticum]KLV01751.1 glycogen debranching protein [Photobacterium aphoticum]PSU58769.1 glycogen debranching enzyme GlgX [Photobacterium aphoticum]GHA32105.1 glycogen operon protein GlgX homolog [Photobacterium aphoticum]
MFATLAQPFPLGATLCDHGCNFSLHNPDNKNIKLVLFNDNQSPRLISLDNQYGDIRYTFVEGIAEGQVYGYQLEDKDGLRLLLDPYAQALNATPHYVEPFTAEQSWEFAKSVVVKHDFDWQGTTLPQIPREETLLLETHVKGFTKRHPEIDPALRGTYLGLCQPEMIAFFKEHGITTLQLLPVTSCMSEPHLLKMNKVNFWGYNSLCFMAPEPRYALHDAVTEMKTMVRELHRHGIEVIMDIVFNHTAEGGEGGPIFHFKRLDKHYYLQDGNKHYRNYTGCGNTVDLTYQPSLNIVLDTLRHWVTYYKIDGFRFDLASTLGREGDRFNTNSAFFKAVAQDPVLKQIKLIAEPWDVGPDGYQLGGFPRGWNECNDKYRDTVKSYWLCKENNTKEFATRIMGSRDLFSAGKWPDKLPVNFISYHDGFTLQDLVSYNQKHNHANGENNRDGHGDNRSYNHGMEGKTTNFAVLYRRERQKRNLMATLLFSFGMPHILAVDLLSHTQGGNNNAYCQDNAISWADWAINKDHDEFRHWLATLIAARKEIMVPFIRAFSGPKRGNHRISWKRSDGHVMNGEDWQKIEAFALFLGLRKDGAEMMFLINHSTIPTRFRLPAGERWRIVCDTSEGTHTTRQVQTTYMQSAQSMTILYRDECQTETRT